MTTKPIVVSENAGTIDTLMALGRLAVVIVGSFTTLLAVLKTRDIAAFLEFIRGSDGTAFIAAVSTFLALGFGLLKSFKRGKQIATVALDSRVPDKVATTK